MEEFEAVVNNLSDSDFNWWPFLFLRPEQHEKLGNLRVAALSALYGVFLGMLINIVAALQHTHVHPVLFPALTTAGFFAFFRMSVAWCWNRRAERLVQGSARE
jgi:hypothetical protein